jgi:hypothetical protein
MEKSQEKNLMVNPINTCNRLFQIIKK